MKMEISNDILVSVCCITYNQVFYIRQCLDGFLMQKTNFKFEVIIHDDCSTDGTTDVIREYVEKYPDLIKPIFQERNQYQNGCKRILATFVYPKAQGKYIALCEGDDYWTDPLKLQKQFDVLESHKECSICFCKINKILKDGTPTGETFPMSNRIKAGIVTIDDFFAEEFSNDNWCFQTSSFFFRSELLLKNDPERVTFFSHFHVGDLPTVLWSLLHGNGFYIDEVGSCYRVFSGGFTTYRVLHEDWALKNIDKWLSAYSYLDSYTNKVYHKHINRKRDFRILDKLYLKGEYFKMINVRFWWQYYKRPMLMTRVLLKIVMPDMYYIYFRDKWRKYRNNKSFENLSADNNYSS